MKSFIVAIVIFLLVTAGVCVNGVYVHRVTEEMTDTAKELSDDVFSADISAMKAIWEKSRSLLCVTISHAEADTIEDTITDIGSRIKSGDSEGYLSAKGKLIELCELLHESEALSFERVI